jgi:hypothetical protein
MELHGQVQQWEDRMLRLFRCTMDFNPEARTHRICMEISEKAIEFARDPQALLHECFQQLATKLLRRP